MKCLATRHCAMDIELQCVTEFKQEGMSEELEADRHRPDP